MKMRVNQVRLILTDIDGTILPRGEQVVPSRVRAAFRLAMAAGIHVGPASGRGMGYVRAAFDGDDDCVATALATNGMQAYLDGKLVAERHLSRNGPALLEQAMRSEPRAGMLAFEGDVPHLVCGDRVLLRESFPRYARGRFLSTRPPYAGHDTRPAVSRDRRCPLLAGKL